MPRQPIIPPQPEDGRSESERFNSFAKRLLGVPKKQIDKEEQKEAKRHATESKEKKKNR